MVTEVVIGLDSLGATIHHRTIKDLFIAFMFGWILNFIRFD